MRLHIYRDMDKINYKSDLKFRLDQPEIPASVDWEIAFYTRSRKHCFRAGKKDGKYYNIVIDESGKPVVCLDGHGLHPGHLMAEVSYDMPDADFGDGSNHVCRTIDTGKDLVPNGEDMITPDEIKIILPFISLTYSDLTDAEKEDLRRPLTEMVAEAEALRSQSERLRDSAEQERVSAEEERQELYREAQGAEMQRQHAEQERASEFAEMAAVCQTIDFGLTGDAATDINMDGKSLRLTAMTLYGVETLYAASEGHPRAAVDADSPSLTVKSGKSVTYEIVRSGSGNAAVGLRWERIND